LKESEEPAENAGFHHVQVFIQRMLSRLAVFFSGMETRARRDIFSASASMLGELAQEE
jgi:hypothetical protein